MGDEVMTYYYPSNFAPNMPVTVQGQPDPAGVFDAEFRQALSTAEFVLSDGALNTKDIPFVDRANREMAQAQSSLLSYAKNRELVGGYRGIAKDLARRNSPDLISTNDLVRGLLATTRKVAEPTALGRAGPEMLSNTRDLAGGLNQSLP